MLGRYEGAGQCVLYKFEEPSPHLQVRCRCELQLSSLSQIIVSECMDGLEITGFGGQGCQAASAFVLRQATLTSHTYILRVGRVSS